MAVGGRPLYFHLREVFMRLLAVMTIALAAAAPATPSAAQDPARYYEDNCAPCHTIGGGAQGGPDLRGVTSRRSRDWLIRFLLDPQALESDPAVVEMIRAAGGMTMPAIDGITRERAEGLIAFIAERSAAPAPGATPAGEPPFTPADIAQGRDLFTGATKLSGAGPACVACHTTANLRAPGGGRLGPDLTAVHSRLGGNRGLAAWLGATPTPMMRAVYRNAELSAPEARALTAYLGDVAAALPPQAPGSSVVAAAIICAIAVVVVAAVAGRNRFRAVRRPFVRHAIARGGSR
jgi:cytochrome c2